MKGLNLIMECGFNVYESKILLSLHQLGEASVKEISQHSQVPRNKVYDILDDLRRNQIVQLLPAKPKKYSIINLEETLKTKIDEKKKNLESINRHIKLLTKKMPLRSEIEEKFWIMEGADSMVNKIVQILDSTQKESIGFIDVWTARFSNLNAIRKAINRGVKFYFLGTINEETEPIAKKYIKLGVRVRNLPIEGAGYSIFDKRYVQLRITERKIITLWIENSYLANILRTHFFQMWRRAKSIDYS